MKSSVLKFENRHRTRSLEGNRLKVRFLILKFSFDLFLILNGLSNTPKYSRKIGFPPFSRFSHCTGLSSPPKAPKLPANPNSPNSKTRREENWRVVRPCLFFRQKYPHLHQKQNAIAQSPQNQNESAPSPAKPDRICSISIRYALFCIFGEKCKFLFLFLPDLILGFCIFNLWIMLVNGGACASLLSFVCLEIVFYCFQIDSLFAL